MKNSKKTVAYIALKSLTRSGFIGAAQADVVRDLFVSEEGYYFIEKIIELFDGIAKMPKTYDQDGLGDDAVAHLHYFIASADWYITEKDIEADQLQAFGWADLGIGEYGYISLREITSAGAELDLYYEPASMREIKALRAADSKYVIM